MAEQQPRQESIETAELQEDAAASIIRNEFGISIIPSGIPAPSVPDAVGPVNHFDSAYTTFVAAGLMYEDVLNAAMELYATAHETCGQYVTALESEAALRTQRSDLQTILKTHDLTDSQAESLYSAVEMAGKHLSEQQDILVGLRERMYMLKARYLMRCETVMDARLEATAKHDALHSLGFPQSLRVLRPVEPNLPMVFEIDESTYMD